MSRSQEVLDIAAQIGPLLRGRGPDIQGAVLAELVSLYIAGHEEGYRPIARTLFLELVDQLTPISARQVWGDHVVFRHCDGCPNPENCFNRGCAKIEAAAAGREKFDCHYDGDWTKCDKEMCAREQVCRRRTS